MGIKNMNEMKIKKIVGTFLRIKPNDISEETIIDATVLQGSVLFARMISKVNALCETDLDGLNVHTYGDLINTINES
jgi:hypothetical protein